MAKPNTDAKDLCDEESDGVRVYVRVRPFNNAEIEASKAKNEHLRSIISMRGPNVALLDHEHDYTEKDAMLFDDTFWSIPPEQQRNDRTEFATQETVFQRCGVPLVENMFEGYNSCIFAYGQTGSGKTYSMMGYGSDTGLIPRLCHNLFDRIESDKLKNPNRRYDVVVMFFEIYNEKVKDLFVKQKGGDEYQGLKVRNHPITGPYVEGLEVKKVFTAADCLRLIDRGAANRTTKSTGMNDTSSRSHAIFKIEFTQTDDEVDDDGSPLPLVRVSQMNLVDLAGSERVKKSKVSADKLTEATNINQSLTTLRKVIDALIDIGKGKKAVAPYRESMLTWVLSESLGGNSKTVMIAAVSPHYNNEEETHSTLRYALRAKSIVNKVRVNESKSARMLREMKEQMAKLQAMIADGDVGANAEIRQQMMAEINAKQEEMKELQEKEKETQRAAEQLLHSLEEEKEKERMLVEETKRKQTLIQETRVMAMEQKKTQFMSAFQNAFKMTRQTKLMERDSTELKRAASDLRRKVQAQETLVQQSVEEIEVYEAQKAKFESEHQNITNELIKKQNDVAGLSRRIDELEAKISSLNKDMSDAVQTSSSRVQSLTEHFSELERHRQVTLVCADRVLADTKAAQPIHEAALAQMKTDGEKKIRTLDARKVVLEESVKRKTLLVADLTAQCSKHQKMVATMTAKIENLRAQRQQVLEEYGKEKVLVNREISEVKHAFALDRSKYCTRIGDGLAILSDIKKIAAHIVPKPSQAEVRAGRSGVTAWLSGLGLERHVLEFERFGFTDLYALANLTEDDLHNLKITGGTRRKVLNASYELKLALREVTQQNRGPEAEAKMLLEGGGSASQNSLIVTKMFLLDLVAEVERWLKDTHVVLSTVSERIQP
eukprot:PhF_6_TR40668/c0_g1_i1/m.61090/K17915/KIF14; kinesin family member 14